MSKRGRIDRFISKECQIKRKYIRILIAKGAVSIDGQPASDVSQQVDEFSHISLNGQILQNNNPLYIMLNKPIGVVSATKDSQHKTVIDLLTHPTKEQLHIVGRLDLNSSGLLLLSNDSRWSSKLTEPQHKVEKRYIVTLKYPINSDYISAFAQGFYFEYEDITTKPAQLKILSEHVAEVVLTEGRYHQIKRMFGRFRNPVLQLHRSAIGNLVLDPQLNAGESRELTAAEVLINNAVNGNA